jgi:hypothetical protein
MVVVLRRPLEQLHHLRVDHRIRVNDLEQRFEFFFWHIRRRGHRVHHSHQMLATERHAHAHARFHFDDGVTCWQVIEQSSQRRIERDAQYHRCRQEVTFQVVHSACG